MRIYNYLFYKTYILAQRSGNFNDAPVLGGIIYVIACVMFNIFTVSFIIQGAGIIETDFIIFDKQYKWIFSILLVILVLAYYYYNGRYKKIISKYEKEKEGKLIIHPLIVIFIYFSTSFALLLISALYKNGDWIFHSH